MGREAEFVLVDSDVASGWPDSVVLINERDASAPRRYYTADLLATSRAMVAGSGGARKPARLVELMAEHPELPVIMMGDQDETPCYYVSEITGSATVGRVAEFLGCVWDDLEELRDAMEEEGFGPDEVERVIATARPCIWAGWDHYRGEGN